jgi:EmrB/QacA subfamily drug resistance transporter
MDRRHGAIAPQAARRGLVNAKATLAACILGSSLAFIDGSVVNVALPLLGHELRASATHVSWAINAYLLPLGALILLGGGLGDTKGRRKMFLIGLCLFGAASMLCAAAPDFDWFLLARTLQGVGAALLMPNSLALLGGAFSGEERGRAIGIWAGVGALAAALGPVAGGWMIDVFGWRSIFLINAPVAGAAGYFAVRFVVEQKERVPRGALDILGALFATLALALLTWSLTESAQATHNVAVIWFAAAMGMGFAGAFLLRQRHLGVRALMPFALFSSASFVGLTLLTLCLYGALGGLVVLLPYLLIQMEHWSALAAGAALLPIPVVIGLGSRTMGRYAARVGGRLPLSMGSALVAIGLALYARVNDSGVHYWSIIFPPTLMVALGMGVCVAPLTTAVMAAVDTDHVGVASGFNSAVARIAGLVATALLGFVFARQASLADFISAFRDAAYLGAVLALLAAAFAVTLLRV